METETRVPSTNRNYFQCKCGRRFEDLHEALYHDECSYSRIGRLAVIVEEEYWQNVRYGHIPKLREEIRHVWQVLISRIREWWHGKFKHGR